MKAIRFLEILLASFLLGCMGPHEPLVEGECANTGKMESSILGKASLIPHSGGALLASRFQSLAELKSVVKLDYFSTMGNPVAPSVEAASVRVTHCAEYDKVVGVLDAGISQGDMLKAQGGGFLGQARLIWDAPFAVVNRTDLQTVMRLARRRQNFFGEGDAAFLDFAERMVSNINTPELAFLVKGDTSEKGYLNTFNHITAQAFITSFYSEELADFVGDVHERHNMPELVTGIFSDSQLVDPIQNPIDNYVDIVNNEWGQELGKQLKAKYNLSKETNWTADLLANYLNDIQAYLGWAFQIGFKPFRPEDEVVFRFTQKINFVMQMRGMEG